MSRIEAARRNVRVARYGIGIGAASLFAALAFVARAAHPGAHSTRSTTTSVATDEEDDSFFFSGGSSGVGPAGSAQPSIQSAGS